MSVGIEFEQETLTEEFRYATEQAAKATFSVSENINFTQSCPQDFNPNPDDPAVGFFVWKVSTNDFKATAVESLGVCRYNTGYWNVAPSCPFAACMDMQCKTCADWN